MSFCISAPKIDPTVDIPTPKDWDIKLAKPKSSIGQVHIERVERELVRASRFRLADHEPQPREPPHTFHVPCVNIVEQAAVVFTQIAQVETEVVPRSDGVYTHPFRAEQPRGRGVR